MEEQNQEHTEWDIEVAKRIACAVISYQAGVAYEDLWDQYAGRGEDIGTFWLSLAKRVRADFPHKPK